MNRIRTMVTAAGIVAVLVAVVVVGQLVADWRADAASPGMAGADRDMVVRAAHDLWDNPIQRLAFRAYGVTPSADAGEDVCSGTRNGPAFEVTAYTLFGIELDRITCRSLELYAPPVVSPLPVTGGSH